MIVINNTLIILNFLNYNIYFSFEKILFNYFFEKKDYKLK